ncbi:2Fe-2S iron-sulfur cluster-binding protein [Blastococcus sp. CT_GayMR20]|uniref:(2Fe-2S)-binding protein n=1 Tax=Blastococcus sp. CT_GayMR20 TaxID=2559609 RepID=UPI001ADD6622|nr:2Fe-2S iron-sulfur cluster-binding protein [Blastococcus sp. CT_GayMR20]
MDVSEDERSAGSAADPVCTAQLSTVANGQPVTADIACHTLLIDFLREEVGVRSARRSCDVQLCGSCSVLVDGLPVSSCCYLAVDVDKKSVLTAEGLRGLEDADPIYTALENAFVEHAAVQCGYCTPGFMVTLWFLIEGGHLTPGTTHEELRTLLKGNLCRCTGYEPILAAASAAVGALAGARGDGA